MNTYTYTLTYAKYKQAFKSILIPLYFYTHTLTYLPKMKFRKRLRLRDFKTGSRGCLRIACLCRLSIAVVCRYINLREKGGREEEKGIVSS